MPRRPRRATIWGGAPPGANPIARARERTVLNTIVVGVDGREGGRDALALADRLHDVFGGELVAVHAYQFDYFNARAVGPDYQNALRENAIELVEGEIERAGVEALAVAMPDGSPGRAL